MTEPKIDKELISNLSDLARITLSQEEADALCTHIQKILHHMAHLDEVDTSDLSPYCHMQEQGIDSLREDTPGKTLDPKPFLQNAPDTIGSLIRVPTIISNNA